MSDDHLYKFLADGYADSRGVTRAPELEPLEPCAACARPTRNRHDVLGTKSPACCAQCAKAVERVLSEALENLLPATWTRAGLH